MEKYSFINEENVHNPSKRTLEFQDFKKICVTIMKRSLLPDAVRLETDDEMMLRINAFIEKYTEGVISINTLITQCSKNNNLNRESFGECDLDQVIRVWYIKKNAK